MTRHNSTYSTARARRRCGTKRKASGMAPCYLPNTLCRRGADRTRGIMRAQAVGGIGRAPLVHGPGAARPLPASPTRVWSGSGTPG